MVASWLLALADLISLPVYIDLWVVNNYKVHIFTSLMKKMDKAKIKKYQSMYYSSLKRDYFCVSDKVRAINNFLTIALTNNIFIG